MVVASDVACNDNGEYQYQHKGGNGNLGHGFSSFFPYLFLLHQFGAGGFLFIVFNVFQQLVDTLAQSASNDAQAADASVQHLGFLLTGLKYLVLNTCNHTADGIYRTVHFIQCIRVFLLNHVAHLGGIFFSWCEYVSQSLEESFLLVMDSVGVMVRNDFSAYMRRTEQRILLSYQAVKLLLINLVGRCIPHGFQHRIHVPLLVLQQGPYGVQTGLLQGVRQNRFQCINRSVHFFHRLQVVIILVQISGAECLPDTFRVIQLADDTVSDVAPVVELVSQAGRSSQQVHLLHGISKSSYQKPHQQYVADNDFERSGEHGLADRFRFISESQVIHDSGTGKSERKSRPDTDGSPATDKSEEIACR